MITLQKIVESIESQLKPHLKEDVIVHREFIIEMINQSRAAMIRKLYNSGESYINYYQEVFVDSVSRSTVNGTNGAIKSKYPLEIITLPGMIMQGMGKKNIQYLGSQDQQMIDIDYCFPLHPSSVQTNVHGQVARMLLWKNIQIKRIEFFS